MSEHNERTSAMQNPDEVIEALEAENARLRAALKAVRHQLRVVASHSRDPNVFDALDAIHDIVDAAIGGREDDVAGQPQQGPKLSTHGHEWGKPYDHGYATCRCGAREDSEAACRPCPDPPEVGP